MSIIVAFVVVMSGMAFWWLSRQNLASKPWLNVDEIDEIRDTGASRIPTAKLGLWLFLAIVCAALALLVSAYFMRIAPDWRRLRTARAQIGCQRLGLDKKPTVVSVKQAVAAVGQARLMRVYDDFFTHLRQTIAQWTGSRTAGGRPPPG